MHWKKIQITAAVLAATVVAGVGEPVTMNLMAADSILRQAQGSVEQNWSQWRGPNRNGAVAQGPALAWPKASADGQPVTNAPVKLWSFEYKLEDSPGYTPGMDKTKFGDWKDDWGVSGHSSPVVADGKALFFALEFVGPNIMHCRGLQLTPEGLREWGGGFGIKLPPELAKAVGDVFRTPPKGATIGWGRISEAGREAWIKTWLEDHIPDPADRQKYGPFISNYFCKHMENSPSIEALEKLDDLIITQKKNLTVAEAYKEAGWNGDWFFASIIGQFVTKAFDTVTAIDIATGKRVWKARMPGDFACSEHLPCSTPCVVGGRVYGATSKGEVYCLNLADGREVWRKQAMRVRAMNDHNTRYDIEASVLVVDGKVIVPASGELAAFSAMDGKELWRQDKVIGGNSSPACWRNGAQTYILATECGLQCVDTVDGALKWKFDGAPGSGCSSPAVEGDIVVYAGDGLRAFKLSSTNAEELWSFSNKEIGTGPQSPLIHGGYVYYVTGGDAICIKLNDGKIAWHEKLHGYGCCSAVLADGKIYYPFAWQNPPAKSLVVLSASPQKFQMLATVFVGNLSHGSPAIAGGKLILGGGCYDLTK